MTDSPETHNHGAAEIRTTVRRHENAIAGVGDVRLRSQSWRPAGPSKAHVGIVHGIGNHGGGYAALAETLAAGGYTVHAIDQRGHGRSDGPRVSVDRFGDLVEDLRTFIAKIRACAGTEPVFLFGHSWGGLVSLAYAISWQDEIDGLVLCAPGIRPAAASPEQIAVVRELARTAPDTPAVEVNLDKLSRNPLAQQAFNDDPLVHRGRIPARMAVETLDAISEVTTNIARITLPILLLHGTEDHVADPSGSQFVYDHVASTDRTLKLYDGLWHQLFNEPERDEVLTDLSDWINSHRQPGSDHHPTEG
jgi:acylglycerol lipase